MDKPITGIMMYYYFVCTRKLWYFSHEIQMEQENELVQIGKIIDDTTFKKEDKHIEIDSVINIDFIKSSKILHEVKKSKAIEDASIKQLKYYLFYLKERGVTGVKGVINYPLLKQKIEVELSEEDEIILGEDLNDIKRIMKEPYPPLLERKKICNKCAYYDLCFA